MSIDIHAHAVIPGYHAQLTRSGVSVPDFVFTEDVVSDSPEAVRRRIALMDSAGVHRQVLSAIIAPYRDRASDATIAARLVNDGHAAMVSRHPDRLSAFATLPLPHIDQALAELSRCLDDLGMAGVSLQCSCLGESLAAQRFDPLYEELDRRGEVVFFHPCVNGLDAPLLVNWGLAASAGAVFEDTTVALHLILGRHPHRFPGVKFVLPHLGGALPMLLARLDNQLPALGAGLTELPSVTARRFWYDTVGHGSNAALSCAFATFGVDRMLLGSDYPVLLALESYTETVDVVRGLHPSDADAILIGNATAVLEREDDHAHRWLRGSRGAVLGGYHR